MTTLLKRALARLGVTADGEGWWHELDSDQKKQYIAEHPNSKYAKQSGGSDDDKSNGKSKEKPIKQAVTKKPTTIKPSVKTKMVEDGTDDKGNKKYKRTQEDGSPMPEHIQKLGLPPAWTDVEFSPDPKASLLAIGRDKKGRKQYVYSEEFAASQAAIKQQRVKELDSEMPNIEKQLADDRKSDDKKKHDNADCMWLISKMGIRPGSDTDTKADVKAIGATTLQGQHVIVDGSRTRLKYIGKDGVPADLEIHDEELAEMVRKRAKAAGDDGKLFSVNEGGLLDYAHTLGTGKYKVKDFRTLIACRRAKEEIEKIDPPRTVKDYKARVREVAAVVAVVLNNTPTIALASYIDPFLFGQWRMAVGL